MEIIRKIPPQKLLLLDKNLSGLEGDYAAVYQDFASDVFEALSSGIDLLRKYNKLLLAFPENIPYPLEMITGFRNFCKGHQFDYEIISEVEGDASLKAGEAYLVIEEADLANLIKQCRNEKLALGSEIGILSFNDTPLKEILADGITVISTDYEKMGETAAQLILSKQSAKIRNPYSMIRRSSL